jgi:methionyl aminopeptidase
MLASLLYKTAAAKVKAAACAARAASTKSSSYPYSAAGWHRTPIQPFPQSPMRTVPASIPRPPYSETGIVPVTSTHEHILIHDADSIHRLRQAGQLARSALDLACSLAHCENCITTDEIDQAVHDYIISRGAYPSPLNYAGFPKSLCSSINEIICHGIPDTRPLQMGDVVSFDVRYA